MKQDAEGLFWAKVERGAGCWRWTAALDRKGYGVFGPGMRLACGSKQAHRVAWLLVRGRDVGNGLLLRNTCGDRGCVNPDHYEAAADPATLSHEERFWSHVDKTGPGGCWLWTAHVHKIGYGVFWDAAAKRLEQAHRAAWVLLRGAIPTGLKVLHRCDVRACVNPDHLFVGTQHDNVKDMNQKGRNRNLRGEQHGRALLTEDQVREIRRRYGPPPGKNKRNASGLTGPELAAEYGITVGALSKIVLGHNWAHLKD